MRKSDKGLVFQDLDRLFRYGTVSSGDGALLESFLTEGNESAFEALVNRHGPMVRGVCRRLLPSPHDADDAFQATFLVLVRKGGRLRDPDRLGPWLHGVAMRVAGKARARASRRKDEAIVDVPSREGGNAEWCDVMPIIDAELARLPAKHRDVLVACLLDGATAEEASHRLDCPVGTVKSRLARARETLRARLTSRGVAPAVALGALTTTDAFAFASPVSSTLIRATLKAVTTKAVAPGVVALTEGVATTMFAKSTFTALVLATGVGLAGLGTAVWIKPSLAQVYLPSSGDQPGGQGQNPALSTVTPDSKARDQHLKEILAATHNYISANASATFPPAAISNDAGQTLLSWRVAILPYLDQSELYQQFHLNEPWDSPHNKALIDRMPAVFETPGAPAPNGQTRIRGFAGKGSVFDPALTTRNAIGARTTATPSAARPRGVEMREITDGTSNTVFVVMARDATIWTRPGELPFVPGQDLPVLDESDPRGYLLGLCDGSVHVLPNVRQNLLLHLITRNGGEVVDTSWFPNVDQRTATTTAHPPTTPPIDAKAPAPTAPAAPASSASSVEQRLQKVEEKLDRLLEKLDAK
ncbi:MAG: sigma-70 family RNA polymerase sigma factor [Paludisphaera borealis]|uniref:sigma-70 family RNA polymerase sigma factor n=1 Tax=Paludisphaera borealis TaxID=1387353 RepID=UPI00283C7027|nr:sigma-70 family RNA polymerase sigma factor [Paludisphaera borealis]MDR3619770.1 sigma-70 family RNA polymerase sigma factor [Paludisphaera borealis]